MLNLKEVKSERLGDSYYVLEHKSGLTVKLYPKRGHNSTYAIFGTKFGSINTKFKFTEKNEIVTVPDGIAHYLEHKLFESEDGDAFKKYAKTGASANAYTSFDMTGYLFSCTENFEESLKILIELVQTPYFTDETVKKEQGIIGQEIKMYQDDPSWRVMFNLYRAMFHEHPVKVEIAGSVESIAKINPDNLYDCYNHFYNLNNMALCIAGKIDLDSTVKLIDSLVKPSKTSNIPESIFPDEPYKIVKNRVVEHLPVSIPNFQIGFKEEYTGGRLTDEDMAQTSIILYTLAAKSSDLYKELLDKNLINESFGYEYFEGPGYSAVMFAGEAREPDKINEVLIKHVRILKENGVKSQDFELAKKALYGKAVRMFNSAENVADTMLALGFAGREIFSSVESIAKASLDDVNKRLQKQLDINNSAISIILPKW